MLKTVSVSILTSILLLISQGASAGFNNALEALYSKDGARMLSEALTAKDQENLHLFVMQLREQFTAKQFLSETEKSQEKSEQTNLYSFTNLLTKDQEKKLIEYLNQAMQTMPKNDEYFESRAAMLYLSFSGGHFTKRNINEFAEWKNSWFRLATEAKGVLTDRNMIELIAREMFKSCDWAATHLIQCLTLAAELGDSYAQSDLGQLYLGETNIDLYSFIRGAYSNVPKLVEVNLQKGYYWAEQSIIHSEFPATTVAYCVIAKRFQYGDKSLPINLKQAYQLYLMEYLGSEASGQSSSQCAKEGLTDMRLAGVLKGAAPHYYKLWQDDDNRLNGAAPPPLGSVKKIELPKILQRPNLHKNQLLIAYLAHGGQVYIYSDGMVKFRKVFTIDKQVVSKDSIHSLKKEIHQMDIIGSPIFIGSLSDNPGGVFVLLFNDNDKTKTIHGESRDFSKMIYQQIQKLISHSFMACDELTKPCFNKSFTISD